ncbi:hypothetical protein B0H14DRAFT_3513916 [Mycena olivaceomarginata]|nr:hypothetical protein B0H14DRAFT_3513916 [Mycena olivaceomarginata]
MSSLTDSPFADRLNTNYIPSDPEIVEILEAQIEQLEIALSQLKELRTSLKAPIDAHRALISPLRRIPQDVLLDIFSSCLPSGHNALIDAAEAPLLLGRVCRHWRDVTYSTPMLWSSIHIPCIDFLYAPPDMIQAWRERWRRGSSDPPLVLYLSLFSITPITRGHLTLVGDAEHLRPFLRLVRRACQL